MTTIETFEFWLMMLELENQTVRDLELIKKTLDKMIKKIDKEIEKR